MRVGDILLERGWVDWAALVRALDEQPRSGMRLCSLLIARGAVELDHASRALGEQLGVAAALRRHLEHRDPTLAALLPAGIARAAIALPIGRMSDGALIVCVRDPSRALHASLARALDDTVVLAVAPAHPLERLVERIYAPRPSVDVDIEIDVEPSAAESLEIPVEVDVGTPHADVGFDIDVVTEPADAGAAVDGAPAAAPSPTDPGPTRPASKPLPVAIRPIAPPAAAPRRAGHSLEGTIASFADIDDVDWLLDVVMTYVASRWGAAVLLAIRDGAAIGVRGHAPQLTDEGVRAFALPLVERSSVQLACEQQRLVDVPPAAPGAAQQQLATLLGEPPQLVAAPLTRGGEVAHVLVVGAPRSDDPDDAAVDLARLVEAIDDVRARIG